MKELKDFINEAIEWEEPSYKNGYGVVTLVRREDLDLSTISEEDFIKFMLEDYNKAVEEYTKICEPMNKKRIQDHIEYSVKYAIKYAEKKWKTQKRRDEYIENIRKNAAEQSSLLEDPKKIFFDLEPDVNMSVIGISKKSFTIDGNSTEDSLKKAYKLMQTTDYFKKGKGWAFKYQAKSKDTNYSFRPYIDIIFDESTKAERKRDEEMLSNAVTNFYSGSNYWGD